MMAHLQLSETDQQSMKDLGLAFTPNMHIVPFAPQQVSVHSSMALAGARRLWLLKQAAGLHTRNPTAASLQDLLGHPKLGAFVTHAGGNSFYEAVHHGAPQVVVPLW